MAKRPTDEGKKRNPIQLLMMAIGTLIGSIIFSILVEWLGMLFIWSDQGLSHSRNMILNELGFLHDDLVNSTLLGITPKEAVDWVFNLFFGHGFDERILKYEKSLLEASLNNTPDGSLAANGVTEVAGAWGGYLAQWFKYLLFHTREFLVAAIYVAMVSLARVVILLLSIPLYVLFVTVGIVDGLVQRDMRRFGGARESGTRYHYSKASVMPVLLIGWMVYISLPFSIHPNLIILPTAMGTAFTVFLTIKNFKKYF